jgi:hypothetical protein
MNFEKSIYRVIEDNWRVIGQALASRNVMHPEINAMREAYVTASLARYNGDFCFETAEFRVKAGSTISEAITFLEGNDFLVYKKHCGRAVVK